MKDKQILCAASLALALLLCACQTPAETGDAASGTDIPLTETGGEGEAGGETSEEAESHLPPALLVCETVFTETEGFPYPFEEELLRDEEGHILLSLGQALYDYDTMWTLLEENFPYFPAIEEDLGIDWREVREEYREVLEGCEEAGYISQMAFIRTIHHCLQKFQMVGHLGLIDSDVWQVYVTIPQEYESVYTHNMKALLSNKKTEEFYGDEQMWQTFWMEEGAADSKTAVPIEEEHAALSEITDGSLIKDRTYNAIGGMMTGYIHGIPYIKLSSFRDWNNIAYGFVSDFWSEIEAEGKQHLIIDIRGNGGGGSAAWESGIVAPLSKESTSSYYFFLGMKAGSLNLALQPDLASRERWHVYEDNTWQSEYPYIRPEKLDEADMLVRAEFPIGNGNDNSFSGKIWVLIDEGCYSAADQFAYFCKQTGFAALVGEPTGGNGIGITPSVMALPYSGLVVRYEAFLGFNLDGTCNGTTGIQPDIPLREGMSALAVCLDTIENES